jgi:hypothetical protein
VIGDRLPKPSSGQASDARNPPSARAVAVDTATRAPDVPEPDRLRRGVRSAPASSAGLRSPSTPGRRAGGRAGTSSSRCPCSCSVQAASARRGTFASLAGVLAPRI